MSKYCRVLFPVRLVVRRPYGGSEDAACDGREEFPLGIQPVRIWPKDKRVAADKVVDNEALE